MPAGVGSAALSSPVVVCGAQPAHRAAAFAVHGLPAPSRAGRKGTPMRHVLGGRWAVAVVGVVAATLLATSATASPSTPTVNRGSAASGWLARQMVDGEHFETDFDGVVYPDQGLTIDTVFAFVATHEANDYATRAITWLAEPDILSGYIGDGVSESYAGSTAKLALAVEILHRDPTHFGGVNLISTLRGLRQRTGRFTDRSTFGDFSNTFSQSLAILALARTRDGVPASAATFLAGTRCADGGYPLEFAQPACVSDVDATALAVQALAAAGRSAASAAGVRWLISVQQPDGGFIGVNVENANSTGLATQALWHAGRFIAAIRATRYLRSLQIGCSGTAANRGAFAANADGFDPSTAPRATAQGTLGLAGVGFADLDSTGFRSGAPVLACARY